MKTPNIKLGILLALALFCSFSVFATGNSISSTITTQPTSVAANHDYTIVWTVADTANVTVNTTAKFYVNHVNVVNQSYTNKDSTPGNNSFTATFAHGYYAATDAVYTNITYVEKGNNTVSGLNVSNTVVVGTSTTVLVASDTLEGLPSLGGAIGGFVGNVVPGIFKFILLIAIAGALVGLLVALIYVVRNTGVRGFERK